MLPEDRLHRSLTGPDNRQVAALKQDMERVEYASMLYDFYGCLLNDSQREVMAMYHEDNLSLSEIAEELGQSRQAVHYTLKKAEKALGEYEEKLALIGTYKNRQKLADRLAELIAGCDMKLPDRAEAAAILEILAE